MCDETCRERLLSEDYIELIMDYALSEYTDQKLDSCYLAIDDTFGILSVKKSSVLPLGPGIYGYRTFPRVYGLTDQPAAGSYKEAALRQIGALQVGNPPLSLTGRGVIIGIIDTGINYQEDVFKDSSGRTRIEAVWDQTIQTGTPPEGFCYGTLYTRDELDKALAGENPYLTVPTSDENGHGTALASAAAGSILAQGMTYRGAAPEAKLVVVKLKQAKRFLREYYYVPEGEPCFQESDILTAIRYVQSFAVPGKQAVVLLLGAGTSLGSHGGTGPLGDYMDKLSLKRNLIQVVSGGNEGNEAAHHVNVFREGSTSVEYRVEENVPGFCMELWGHLPGAFRIAIRAPGGEKTAEVTAANGSHRTFRFIYDHTTVSADLIETDQGTGREVIFLRFADPTPGIWTLYVSSEEENPITDVFMNRFHAWLPIQSFTGGKVYFLEPTPDVTLTEPSNASGVFTVNGYNNESGSFALRSGRGFAESGMIKPDLSAPGVQIPAVPFSYSGSGMAAALAAGSIAQVMQWAVTEGNSPFIETKELKSLLIRSAGRQDEETYPNTKWGFGRMNTENLFRLLSRGVRGSI